MYQEINADVFMYGNYTLDCSRYDLTPDEDRTIEVAIDLVENDWSLAELSRNSGIPRSTLQRKFQNDLKGLSFELYQLVQKRYKEHINHTKG